MMGICIYEDDCLVQTAILTGITLALLARVARADKENREGEVRLVMPYGCYH